MDTFQFLNLSGKQYVFCIFMEFYTTFAVTMPKGRFNQTCAVVVANKAIVFEVKKKKNC